MKGRTRIELTDVNTGEKEIHEDENMFTNALQEIYNNNFLYQGVSKNEAYFGTLIRDLTSYDSIIGGIFCLDKKLDEDASIIEVPDGVTVTAHASAPYTGNSSTRGSLNTTESGEVDNGYKFVWDFATNQGNGKIACVGLTTSHGGKCGGDDFGVADGSFLNSTLCYNATGYRMYSASGGYLEFCGYNGVIDDDNYLWLATNSSSTVVYLRKSSTPYPLTSPILKKYGSDVMTSFYLDEEVALTLPVSINTNSYTLRLSIDNGNIYIIAAASSSSNGIYVFEVDFDNGIVTNYYNVPSSIIDNTSQYNSMGHFVSIINGYLYYANSSNCMEKIDFKNAEVILTSPSYSESIITLNYTELYGLDYNGHVFWGCSSSSSFSYYYYYYYYWDEENNKIHRLGHFINNYASGAVKWLSPFYVVRLGSSSGSSSYSIYESIFAAAKPLLTINNLESAVTKTSAQTMKITYTVTEN